MGTDGAPIPQLIRRTIDSRRTTSDAETAEASSAAFAADDVYRSLSRWLGAGGCHALFSRARTDALESHPSLGALTFRPGVSPYLAGVEEGALEHSDTAMAQAIESMLVGTTDLLGRLIGADTARNLIERSVSHSPQVGVASSKGARKSEP
ncbi:MAG: hypothetical protein ACR2GK_08015 [Gemmatimonadaceae bacterium]